MDEVLLWIFVYLPLGFIIWKIQAFFIGLWLMLGNMIWTAILVLYITVGTWIWDKVKSLFKE